MLLFSYDIDLPLIYNFCARYSYAQQLWRGELICLLILWWLRLFYFNYISRSVCYSMSCLFRGEVVRGLHEFSRSDFHVFFSCNVFSIQFFLVLIVFLNLLLVELFPLVHDMSARSFKDKSALSFDVINWLRSPIY